MFQISEEKLQGVSGDPRLVFYVYGFDLSDRIWLVSVVMVLVVVSFLTYLFVCIVYESDT
jgi:hypothetical protein